MAGMPVEELVKGRRSGRAPREPWLLTGLLYDMTICFGREWAALDARVRRVWLLTATLGWLTAALFTAAVVAVGRAFQRDESELLLRIADATPFSFSGAVWVETPGNTIVIISVALLAFAMLVRRGLPLHGLTTLAAAAFGALLTIFGWTLWDRPRPDLIAEGLAAPGWHSFPSGHMIHTAALYGMLIYLWARASTRQTERFFALLVYVILLLAVGLSRLRLGAHWPSDVLAGAAIGIFWLCVLIVALRRAEAAKRRAERA
jgi:undecaprenyl-diphosphatase